MSHTLSEYLRKGNPGTQANGVVILEDGEDERATGVNSGEHTISGTTALPTSDDNVLEAAQEAGLYQEADEENPHELNVAQEVAEAETAFRDEQPE